MCDCDEYETAVCLKCYGNFSNCDCESSRLRMELNDAKKEIKELKKLLKDKLLKEKK